MLVIASLTIPAGLDENLVLVEGQRLEIALKVHPDYFPVQLLLEPKDKVAFQRKATSELGQPNLILRLVNANRVKSAASRTKSSSEIRYCPCLLE